ncbi:MAG TPA: hypothetical protein DEO88_06570 [Syntrophobacteraceae bacterium]|nr:hypothetical protein [Syntrophobacteraceae bacterium]
MQNLGLLGLVTVLAIIGAWLFGDLFIMRQVNALLEVTKEVSSGNLSARTHSPESKGELNRLAQAFDLMAESLLQREMERQSALESLRESEERYRQTAEDIHEVLWMADLERIRMIYINAAYENIRGRNCSDLIEDPRSWLEAVR